MKLKNNAVSINRNNWRIFLFLWICFLGFEIWGRTKATKMPPFHDGYSYYQKAHEFWDKVHQHKLGNLEKPVTFMVLQAQNERNRLIEILKFTLSLSKCWVFRDPHNLIPLISCHRFARPVQFSCHIHSVLTSTFVLFIFDLLFCLWH